MNKKTVTQAANTEKKHYEPKQEHFEWFMLPANWLGRLSDRFSSQWRFKKL